MHEGGGERGEDGGGKGGRTGEGERWEDEGGVRWEDGVWEGYMQWSLLPLVCAEGSLCHPNMEEGRQLRTAKKRNTCIYR